MDNDAKVELFALLDYVPDADLAIEAAIQAGDFDGGDLPTCAYGIAAGIRFADSGDFTRLDIRLLKGDVSGLDMWDITPLEEAVLPIRSYIADDMPCVYAETVDSLLAGIAEWRALQVPA